MKKRKKKLAWICSISYLLGWSGGVNLWSWWSSF